MFPFPWERSINSPILTLDPRRPLKWFFLKAVLTHRWFHSRDSKKLTAWWRIHDRMSESLSTGKLLHSLFASFWSLLSFALSNKMQSKICYREQFNRCKMYRMGKICLELGTFKEFATAVLPRVCCKLRSSAPRDVYHHVITSFESREWNQRCVKQPEKKSNFKGRLGSIVINLMNSSWEYCVIAYVFQPAISIYLALQLRWVPM